MAEQRKAAGASTSEGGRAQASAGLKMPFRTVRQGTLRQHDYTLELKREARYSGGLAAGREGHDFHR